MSDESEKPYGIQEFGHELREAVMAEACGSRRDAVRLFFVKARGRVPEVCRGLSDRTYGWFFLTTILRTLGDGILPTLAKFWLPRKDVEEACRAILNHELPEEIVKGWAQSAAEAADAKPDERKAGPATAAKLNLVKACEGAITAVKAMLVHEPNHIMQHQLHSLLGELGWCTREYGGTK